MRGEVNIKISTITHLLKSEINLKCITELQTSYAKTYSFVIVVIFQEITHRYI